MVWVIYCCDNKRRANTTSHSNTTTTYVWLINSWNCCTGPPGRTAAGKAAKLYLYSSSASVHSSVDFQAIFLHGISERYEWYSCNLIDITETRKREIIEILALRARTPRTPRSPHPHDEWCNHSLIRSSIYLEKFRVLWLQNTNPRNPSVCRI